MNIKKNQIESTIKKNIDGIIKKGAQYCDVRYFAEDVQEHFTLDNSNLITNSIDYQNGIGIRVLYAGAWGFSATNYTNDIGLCFEQAFRNAQSSSLLTAIPLHMGPKPYPAGGIYESPVTVPFTSISTKEKADFLFDLDSRSAEEWIQKRIFKLRFQKQNIYFVNSESTEVHKSLHNTFATMILMGLDTDRLMQKRSKNLHTLGTGTRGYELLSDRQLFVHSLETLKHELYQLINAPNIQPGEKSLILLPGQGFLQLHETIGHPLELDRILGYELSYAGGSFVKVSDIGTLQYGSPKLSVNVFGDILNSPGTFGFDDEGTAQHSYLLIDKGILVNVISSRSTVEQLNRIHTRGHQFTSGATARASSFYRSPLERMSNINIAPGTDGTLEDIIQQTEDGIIMDNPVSWSIGSNREHFHFSCEIGWAIKNGKITQIVKNPSYHGHTLPFYHSLSAVGNETTWQVEQIENCGKGEPNQAIELGHGVPVLKFDNVSIGE